MKMSLKSNKMRPIPLLIVSLLLFLVSFGSVSALEDDNQSLTIYVDNCDTYLNGDRLVGVSAVQDVGCNDVLKFSCDAVDYTASDSGLNYMKLGLNGVGTVDMDNIYVPTDEWYNGTWSYVVDGDVFTDLVGLNQTTYLEYISLVNSIGIYCQLDLADGRGSFETTVVQTSVDGGGCNMLVNPGTWQFRASCYEPCVMNTTVTIEGDIQITTSIPSASCLDQVPISTSVDLGACNPAVTQLVTACVPFDRSVSASSSNPLAGSRTVLFSVEDLACCEGNAALCQLPADHGSVINCTTDFWSGLGQDQGTGQHNYEDSALFSTFEYDSSAVASKFFEDSSAWTNSRVARPVIGDFMYSGDGLSEQAYFLADGRVRLMLVGIGGAYPGPKGELGVPYVVESYVDDDFAGSPMTDLTWLSQPSLFGYNHYFDSFDSRNVSWWVGRSGATAASCDGSDASCVACNGLSSGLQDCCEAATSGLSSEDEAGCLANSMKFAINGEVSELLYEGVHGELAESGYEIGVDAMDSATGTLYDFTFEGIGGLITDVKDLDVNGNLIPWVEGGTVTYTSGPSAPVPGTDYEVTIIYTSGPDNPLCVNAQVCSYDGGGGSVFDSGIGIAALVEVSGVIKFVSLVEFNDGLAVSYEVDLSSYSVGAVSSGVTCHENYCYFSAYRDTGGDIVEEAWTVNVNNGSFSKTYLKGGVYDACIGLSPDPCSTYITENSCAVNSCEWDDPLIGNTHKCTNEWYCFLWFTETSCASRASCDWVLRDPNTCYGPVSCSDKTSEALCLSSSCTWGVGNISDVGSGFTETKIRSPAVIQTGVGPGSSSKVLFSGYSESVTNPFISLCEAGGGSCEFVDMGVEFGTPVQSAVSNFAVDGLFSPTSSMAYVLSYYIPDYVYSAGNFTRYSVSRTTTPFPAGTSNGPYFWISDGAPSGGSPSCYAYVYSKNDIAYGDDVRDLAIAHDGSHLLKIMVNPKDGWVVEDREGDPYLGPFRCNNFQNAFTLKYANIEPVDYEYGHVSSTPWSVAVDDPDKLYFITNRFTDNSAVLDVLFESDDLIPHNYVGPIADTFASLRGVNFLYLGGAGGGSWSDSLLDLYDLVHINNHDVAVIMASELAASYNKGIVIIDTDSYVELGRFISPSVCFNENSSITHDYDRNYVFVSGDSCLNAFDVSDPSDPYLVGTAYFDSGDDIYYHDGFIYSHDFNSIRVINVYDVEDMFVVNSAVLGSFGAYDGGLDSENNTILSYVGASTFQYPFMYASNGYTINIYDLSSSITLFGSHESTYNATYQMYEALGVDKVTGKVYGAITGVDALDTTFGQWQGGFQSAYYGFPSRWVGNADDFIEGFTTNYSITADGFNFSSSLLLNTLAVDVANAHFDKAGMYSTPISVGAAVDSVLDPVSAACASGERGVLVAIYRLDGRTQFSCFTNNVGVLSLVYSFAVRESAPKSVATVDLDGDGVDEIVSSSGVYNTLGEQLVDIPFDDVNTELAVVDWNSDSFIDLFYTSVSTIHQLISAPESAISVGDIPNIAGCTAIPYFANDKMRVLVAPHGLTVEDPSKTYYTASFVGGSGSYDESFGVPSLTLYPSLCGERVVEVTARNAAEGSESVSITCDVVVPVWPGCEDVIDPDPEPTPVEPDPLPPVCGDCGFDGVSDFSLTEWHIISGTPLLTEFSVKLESGTEINHDLDSLSTIFYFTTKIQFSSSTDARIYIKGEDPTTGNSISVAEVRIQDGSFFIATPSGYERFAYAVFDEADPWWIVNITVDVAAGVYRVQIGDSVGDSQFMNPDVKILNLFGFDVTYGLLEVDYVTIDGSRTYVIDKTAEEIRRSAAIRGLVNCSDPENNGWERNFTQYPAGTISNYGVVQQYCDLLLKDSGYCSVRDLQLAIAANPDCYYEAHNYCQSVTFVNTAGFNPKYVDKLAPTQLTPSLGGEVACTAVLGTATAFEKVVSPIMGNLWFLITDNFIIVLLLLMAMMIFGGAGLMGRKK